MKLRADRQPSAAPLLSAAIVLGVALAGCKKPPPVALATLPSPAASASAGRPLSFEPTPNGFGVALPPGCSERAPSVRAPLAGRSVYFVAGDEPAGSIVLVDRAPSAAAVWASFREGARSAPLFDLEAPRIAFDGKAFRGLYAAGPSDARTVVLTRAGDAVPRALAAGDALSVLDFRCREGRCVALLPHVGRVAMPGISLLTGNDSDAPWVRRDLDLGDGEKPLGITALGASRRTAIATTLGEEVLVREVDDTTVEAHAPLSLPFGVLDTAMLPGRPTERAVAIGHGARVVGDCAEPRPAALLGREGLPSVSLPLAAPLLHATLRPLGTGGIAVYSAALRCREERKRYVTAQLLDETGAPRGASMVVAEARGFAVSTRGEEIDFVILRDAEVVVAQARCPSPPPTTRP